MGLVDLLKNKKIKVIEAPKLGSFLRKQWENNFANHLSDNEKSYIYLHDFDGCCGFLWHLFSNEKRDCLKEEEAIEAFNKETKNDCYLFYQHSDYALILENADLLTADIFENEMDIYVVDKDFEWTYVKTHETGWCGPYFCRK